MREVATSARTRRQRIREQVTAAGHVRIDELVARHGVSLMTIHRDLDALQNAGWLRKVRGGATTQPSAVFHGDVDHRMQTMLTEKQSIAKAAVELVEPGQAIALDDSTTAFEVAKLLPGRGPITVVTNFLPTIDLLARATDIDLIGLGGTYYPAYGAFLGMQTVDAVRPLATDLLLMSTTAITGGACFHQTQETLTVKRALMDTAATKVLLADHTRFRRRGLHRLALVTEFDHLYVDAATDPDALAALRDQGATVVLSPPAA